MKIITKNAVYVQKKDIAYLRHTKLPIFWPLSLKIFGNELSLLEEKEEYEFIKFSKQKEIGFFKNLDWIIDYNDIKELTESQLMDLFYKNEIDRKKVEQKLNAMSSLEREKNKNLIMLLAFLNFKMCSLKDILLFKQGILQIKFPEITDNSLENDSRKSIGKMVRSRFKNKKN